MIFTRLYVHNLYNFYEAELDLTLTKKVKDSTVESEFLEGRPLFRFKRVCILSGANASGKTSLGHILFQAQQFICIPSLDPLHALKAVRYRKQESAVLEVEFVTPNDYRIHLLSVIFHPDGTIRATVHSTPVGVKATAASARKKLIKWCEGSSRPNRSERYGMVVPKEEKSSQSQLRFFSRLLSSVGKNNRMGWHYMMSDNSQLQSNHFGSVAVDASVLSAVLRTFDPSITGIQESHDDDGHNGYSIKFSNGESVLINKEGRPTNPNRLSKGTFDAIDVAVFASSLRSLIKVNNPASAATFYLDEKMASAHSELEQAVVNLLIERLGRHAQLFYTTHNYDVLDMNLPVHSFTFLKKCGDRVQFVHPEETFKRNDRRLLNYVRNDVFHTLPDTTLIDQLLFEEL